MQLEEVYVNEASEVFICSHRFAHINPANRNYYWPHWARMHWRHLTTRAASTRLTDCKGPYNCNNCYCNNCMMATTHSVKSTNMSLWGTTQKHVQILSNWTNAGHLVSSPGLDGTECGSFGLVSGNWTLPQSGYRLIRWKKEVGGRGIRVFFLISFPISCMVVTSFNIKMVKFNFLPKSWRALHDISPGCFFYGWLWAGVRGRVCLKRCHP